jgi:hypothetical protein
MKMPVKQAGDGLSGQSIEILLGDETLIQFRFDRLSKT